MKKIAVIGGGAWGTCFAKICADAGNEVLIWCRDPQQASQINKAHANPRHLHAILPESVRATEREEEVGWGQIVVSALPCQALRSALPPFAPFVKSKPILSLSKGLEKGSAKFPSQIVSECLGVGQGSIFALSGPNLAALLAKREPAGAVLAGEDGEGGKALAEEMKTEYFALFPSSDVIGVQIWGAMKNVAAMACGMAQGAGYGKNTQAVLISAAMKEIERLAVKLGSSPKTMEGLAGIGDLVCTATSPLSRNFSLGFQIGSGSSPQKAKINGVAEGRETLSSALLLSERHSSPMPLAFEMREVMEGRRGVASLLSNVLRKEI